MPQNIDAIVIGGGVAGATAAILLGQKGQKILLFEREKSAHHKVCGEFISYEAKHYLTDLGIDLDALGAESIDHIRLIKDKIAVTSDLPFQAVSLSRFILDNALLEKAAQENAEIILGVTVNQLEKTPQGWRVKTSRGEFFSDAVFLACGKHDLKGWSRANGKQNTFIGFKMHFQLSPENEAAFSKSVQVFLFQGGYAGLEPVEDGKANLCLVVKKSRYISNEKNWNKFLKNLLLEAPILANQLIGAIACWEKPLAVYNIPYGFLHNPSASEPPGLYRLGDQMAVIPSFCGEGIALAMHTAYNAVFSMTPKIMRRIIIPACKKNCAHKLGKLPYYPNLHRQIPGNTASWLDVGYFQSR